MDDKEIIDLYWERSENAINETDKKYRNRCLNIAKNILNDIYDAEECLNDTYLTAWNLMPTERPEFLNAFLFRIIKNHSLNRLRHITSDKRRPDVNFSFDELAECIGSKSDTESEFDESELVDAINEFVESLDNGKRYIFIRRYWYLDSQAQIARQCSVKEENIKTILARIRKKLKDFLNERGFNG
ncbi:MAG: sigma-70 family RNA polymerase sigma factor [Oscillospiraceae bacterium]|nr:sigma-70 family RNA polymerase sigma factor [Oscillospiraceae bacterium]